MNRPDWLQPVGRRDLITLLLRVLCFRGILLGSTALAASGDADRRFARHWLLDLNSLSQRLRASSISQQEWQDGIAALYKQVEFDRVMELIDLPRLAEGLSYPDDLAVVRDVTLPRLPGMARSPRFGHKVFALKRGAAVIPHAHNNMVSAHLVLQGTFRVRTYHRLGDAHGHLLLRPRLDATFGPGQVLTMGDERDNVHWLVATSDHAFTFDTPVANLAPGKFFATPANEWNMIYVDPTVRPESDGSIRAPVISFEEGRKRFGFSG